MCVQAHVCASLLHHGFIRTGDSFIREQIQQQTQPNNELHCLEAETQTERQLLLIERVLCTVRKNSLDEIFLCLCSHLQSLVCVCLCVCEHS